jgi:glutamyl-tRNA synthetase/glutamyl-Q tRNA(Asp) synthetase
MAAPLRDRLRARLPGAGWRTRFAPAPTGYLHLGHLVNAIHVWGIARAYGGTIALRVEDHDRTRCRPEYERALIDDLAWLGLEPDEGTLDSYRARHAAPHRAGDDPPHPLRQSDNSARYAGALALLEARGLVYPCRCTRRAIAGLVPRALGEEVRYPGVCRTRCVGGNETHARRVRLEPRVECFDDLRLGPMVQTPAEQCGDLLARDRHGSWTYQFAVSVDDTEGNIDVVIRGGDLLASTGRQIQLARLLGRADPPLYLHHMLLRRDDGAKLSKATNDTSLRERRAGGATAPALLGEAAFLAGLASSPAPIGAGDLPSLFH